MKSLLFDNRRWLWLTFFATLIAVLYFGRLHSAMVDFQVYYLTGIRFIAGEPLYLATDGHFQFKYMPASAIYFLPFSLLPLGAAKLIWLELSVAAICFLFAISFQLAKSPHSTKWMLILTTLLILGKCFGRELFLGQINVFFALLLVLSLKELMSGREYRAGLCLALATIIKPYSVLFIPYLFWKRKPLPAIVAIAIVGVFTLLPVPWYGINGTVQLHQQWFSSLSVSTPSLFTNADNVSLFGFFAKWIGMTHPALLSFCVMIFTLIVGIAFFLSTLHRHDQSFSPETRQRAYVLEWSFLLVMILLLAPLGWDYLFLSATLGVMALIAYHHELSPILRNTMIVNFVIIGGTLYDIMGPVLYGKYMALSITTVNYVFVLLLLLIMRFKLNDKTKSTYNGNTQSVTNALTG